MHRGMAGVTHRTMLDAGLSPRIMDSMRELQRRESINIRKSVQGLDFAVTVVPTDEILFIQQESEDCSMCRKMVLAMTASEDKADRGPIGHLKLSEISVLRLEEAALFAERLTPLR